MICCFDHDIGEQVFFHDTEFNPFFGFNFLSLVEAVHDGYFSIDKSGKNKGHFKDTTGVTQADETTYNTIMKDKEWLLSCGLPSSS
jgi:hypothetical protein